MFAILSALILILSASPAAVDITGTWEVTLHTPGAGPVAATYVLKQAARQISGTYDGPGGPGEITGTIKDSDVEMIVTVPGQRTGHVSGTLSSATRMSGTVTGWSSTGAMPWSAEKKK